jgi:prolactin regulatory element-binding protein
VSAAMAPKKPKPNTKKFGMPLYASAWVDERSLLVAGGGGKKSSGIPNRVCVATFDGDTLSEPLFSCHTDETAPQALVMFPDASRVLCVFGGDVAVYDVTRAPDAPRGDELGEDENADPPETLSAAGLIRSPYVVTPSKTNADGTAVRSTIAEVDIKCAVFNRDGSKLAVGLEDGGVALCSWRDDADRTSGLVMEKELIGKHRDAVTCIDFSSDDALLLTTSSESAVKHPGVVLWSVERKERVAALEDPSIRAAVKKKSTLKNARDRTVVASYRRAEFAKGFHREDSIVTVLNIDGEGFVTRWRCDPSSAASKSLSWKHDGSLRATRDPVASSAVSRDGESCACGTSEGSVTVLEVFPQLRVRSHEKSAHMIFVTTMAFSTDSNVILSGSADASARCANARRVGVAGALLRMVLALFLIVVAALGLTVFVRGGGVAGFAGAFDGVSGSHETGHLGVDADGGVDLMRGIDLADAAAQAREELAKMAQGRAEHAEAPDAEAVFDPDATAPESTPASVSQEEPVEEPVASETESSRGEL